MTKRNLGILLGVTALLALLYLASSPVADHSGPIESVRLLDGVPGEQIRKISLEKAGQLFELEYKDSAWTVPSRGNYPANAGKVRALLLKVLDLSTTQKVPSSEDGIKKLGLDEEGVKSQYSRIRFYGEGDKELGGLYLGKVRTSGKPGETPLGALPMSGQYVRRLNENDIYLIGLPINVLTDLTNWLETNLINILPSMVHKVRQAELSPGQAAAPVFELVSAEKAGPTAPTVHTLVGDVPQGEEVHTSVVSQVASGLENLSLADVHKADSAEVKDAVFDRETKYYLTNGLVYAILTGAAANEKVFAKISVAYDADLVKELEARNQKAAAAATPTPTPAPAADGKKDEAAESSTAEKKSEFAAPEDAKKRGDELAPWVYEFASYQGTKFRKSRADLLKKKGEEKKAEASAGAHGAAPDSLPPEFGAGVIPGMPSQP